MVLALLAGRPALVQTGTAQVDRVIDGDTIRVRLDGARDTLRLTGVDTPETTHPTRGVEPDGPEAADDTTARLTGATVRLDLDAYGRILRYVMLASGENFNATLIRDGYATAIRTFPYSRQREFLQLEAQAGRGQWGRLGQEPLMLKETPPMTNDIATAGTLSTKASKALDTMRARAVKADEARTDAAHHARAAQVVAAATEAATANRAAAEAWDALATQAATQADQYRHGAELADRTRHRWAG